MVAVFVSNKANDSDIGCHHSGGGSCLRRRRSHANQRAYGYEDGSSYGHNAGYGGTYGYVARDSGGHDGARRADGYLACDGGGNGHAGAGRGDR